MYANIRTKIRNSQYIKSIMENDPEARKADQEEVINILKLMIEQNTSNSINNITNKKKV
jgi:hypothetical protein